MSEFAVKRTISSRVGDIPEVEGNFIINVENGELLSDTPSNGRIKLGDYQHAFTVDAFPEDGSDEIVANSFYTIASTGETRVYIDKDNYVSVSRGIISDFDLDSDFVSDDTLASSQAIKNYVDDQIAALKSQLGI